MQLTELDLGDGDPIGTALTILRALGDRALPLAEAQIGKCIDRPDLAARWQSIVRAMRTFVQVDAHLKIALDLLDHLDTTVAAARLDSAIVELGLRRAPETAFQLHPDDPGQSDTYYTHRVQQHLALAGNTNSLKAKGRH